MTSQPDMWISVILNDSSYVYLHADEWSKLQEGCRTGDPACELMHVSGMKTLLDCRMVDVAVLETPAGLERQGEILRYVGRLKGEYWGEDTPTEMRKPWESDPDGWRNDGGLAA